jgi:hypothetical protein
MERRCACGYEDWTCDDLLGVYATEVRAHEAAEEEQERMRAGKWTVPEHWKTLGAPEDDNWRGLFVEEHEVVG